MNFLEFLKYGAIGVSSGLCVLIYFLLLKQQKLQLAFKVNKETHKSFNKLIYLFFAICFLISLIGYGTEVFKMEIEREDKNHNFLTLKEEHNVLVVKHDQLSKDFIDLKMDNVKYKTTIDLIMKESNRKVHVVTYGPGSGGSSGGGVPTTAVKDTTKTKSSVPFIDPKIPAPKDNVMFLSQSNVFEFNTKRILEGKKPLDEKEFLEYQEDVKKQWAKYRKDIDKWLEKHPDQIEFYPFAKSIFSSTSKPK